MSETELSKKWADKAKKIFPCVQLKRNHAGLAKGWHGGIIQLGEKSWPDRDGFLPNGKYIGIEFKDPDGKTDKKREAQQDAKLEEINSNGAVGLKIESWEALEIALLKELGCENGLFEMCSRCKTFKKLKGVL